MKKRITVIFSIISAALCAMLLVFGVVAATKTSFSLSNNILYTPTATYLQVTGSISGYDKNRLSSEDLEKVETTFSTETENSPNPDGFLTSEWNVPNLHFKDKATPIVFTFVIKNITEQNPSSVAVKADITGYLTSEKLVKVVQKYRNVGDDGDETGATKLGANEDLIINPGEVAVLKFLVYVNENYTEDFKNENNNFTVVFE